MTLRHRSGRLILWLAIVGMTTRPDSQGLPNGLKMPVSSEIWLEGSIGDHAHVRLYLSPASWPKSTGPKPDGIEGMYYYTKYWEPIPLDGACLTPGDCLSAGRLRLDEGAPLSEAAKPKLELEISSSGQVVGQWTSADGSRKLPVRLQKVDQPEGFDAAIRRPRRFTDSRWLITFEYPQGWLLRVIGTTLQLRSPDPSGYMFDKQLTCTRGTGLPNTPGSGDQVEWFKGDFGLTMNGWRAKPEMSHTWSPTECENESCEVPEVRRVRTAAIMSTETGYRGYGPWGYRGMVSSNEYLVIDGADWVHCRDRLFMLDRIAIRSTRR